MGATAQTVPFVEYSKKWEIKTYVADHVVNSPAKKYADVPLLINCFHVDELERLVNEEKIDGILLGCADVLLPYYQQLCERTNKFCYATREQVKVFGNKKGLKQALKDHELPTIPEYDLMNGEIDFNQLSYPLFVKPVDNNSSKGMSVCHDYSEMEKCCSKALSASTSKTILIEKYMVCDDICVTYTFIDKEVYVTSISDRYVNRENLDTGTITTALIYPSKYTDLYFDTMHKKMCELFQSLEICNGVLTIQAFVEDGKIMFYDPAFRTTGGQGYIFFNHFGILDQVEMLITFALSGKMVLKEKCLTHICNFGDKWAANLVILIKTGIIKDIQGFEEIESIKGVLNITQSHFNGDAIVEKGTLDQAVARLHIVADSKKELSERIKKSLSLIHITDENGNDMLIKQFDSKMF